MVAMKFIISIILMFLTAQGFSKSPEGKGLKCNVKKMSNGKEVPHHKRLFYWFDKKKFLEFTVMDLNGRIEWGSSYKNINDPSASFWRFYTFNAEFIEFDDFHSSRWNEDIHKITINRKNLEIKEERSVIYKKSAYPTDTPPSVIYTITGTCEVVKSKEAFDDILEEEKKRINKSYRKNKI